MSKGRAGHTTGDVGSPKWVCMSQTPPASVAKTMDGSLLAAPTGRPRRNKNEKMLPLALVLSCSLLFPRRLLSHRRVSSPKGTPIQLAPISPECLAPILAA